MRISCRSSVIGTAAVISLSAFAASAAPPVDPETPAARSVPAAKPWRQDTRPTIDQRITDLHARLMISAAQQPQWDSFTKLMRENAQGMDHTVEQRIKTMPAMTAPENMQSYAQVAANHAEAMQKMVPAFQALYDTMSDDQKKTADQVFRADRHGEHARHG